MSSRNTGHPEPIPQLTDPAAGSLPPIVPASASSTLAPVTVYPPEVRALSGAVVPAAQFSSSLNALALLKALRRRWLQALTFGVLGAGLVAAVTWYVMPRANYTAQARLQMAAVPERIIFQTSEAHSDYATFQRTQVELIKSRFVLNAALRQPQIAQLTMVQAQADPVEWLGKELQVGYSGGSEILTIGLSGEKPQELALLVNAVKDAYLNGVVLDGHKKRVDRLRKLEKLYGDYDSELKQQRNTLRELAKTIGVGDSKVQALQQQFLTEMLGKAKKDLAQSNEEMRTAQLELEQLQAKEKQLAEEPVPEAVVTDHLNKDPVIQREEKRVQELEEKIRRLERALNDSSNHPDIVIYRKEIQSLKSAIAARRDTIRPEIEGQLRNLMERETKTSIAQIQEHLGRLTKFKTMLEGDHKRLEEEVGNVREGQFDSQGMQRRNSEVEATVSKVGLEIQALKVELDAPARVKLLDEAEVPNVKDEKKPIRMAGMAGGGVFALIILAISWLEFRAQRIDAPDEVVQTLGMRLIGSLPGLPSRTFPAWFRPRAVDEVSWQNLMTESVDTARTMLLHTARVESLRIVMVTSAVSGEGKTSLSSHLAASLARSGRKTLLVDCDLRKPAAHELFEQALSPGLSEILRGEVNLATAIRRTPLSELWLLPAGVRNSRAIQALAQPPIEGVFHELRDQFDFIIVDSCPVLPTADSLLVSQHVDAVLFSILRGVSQLPKVYAAYQRLAVLGTRMLGAVVNGAQHEGSSSGYGYAYQSRD